MKESALLLLLLLFIAKVRVAMRFTAETRWCVFSFVQCKSSIKKCKAMNYFSFVFLF